ncbi:DinB family protein [Actinoplanes sp. NPDC049316]|uniref:DinB family protein n=1 Tax=Actinoplanes sp. NPDC049316 TaxID=3154727 RepID=UPI0034494E1E
MGILRKRASTFFGAGSVPEDADMFDRRHWPARLPGTASEGVELLERSYRWWRDGVAGLDEDGLLRQLGPKGAFFAAEPMATLVLHLNREVFHHGGEVGICIGPRARALATTGCR